LTGRSELLSIIVPVYNEVRTVRAVIDRLLSIDLPIDREILVVDDGSTDGTREVLRSIAGDGRGVCVLEAERNNGKGSAIRRGLEQARGSIVAIQDADLELDPAQLADLVAPIVAGEANVVYGSRFLGGRGSAPWHPDGGHQPPVRLVADRHGNLLQGDQGGRGPRPRAAGEPF
jgi:glycosyltransferase involved in cell wall biosynthesis